MDYLRKQVLEYIEQKGVKQVWFCKQLNISSSQFSLFLQGQRNLSEEVEEKLKEILRKST